MRVEALQFHGRIEHQQAEHTQEYSVEVPRIRDEEDWTLADFLRGTFHQEEHGDEGRFQEV